MPADVAALIRKLNLGKVHLVGWSRGGAVAIEVAKAQPPLGYDVEDRKLVVNTQEAETVRQIFRRYRELKSVRLLKADLDAQGIVSKARKASDGSAYGSKP